MTEDSVTRSFDENGAVQASDVAESLNFQITQLNNRINELTAEVGVARAEGRAQRAEGYTMAHAEWRDYAIDKHRDGTICRTGLDEALDHFGLEAYDARWEVRLEVTVRFDYVPADNESSAQELAEQMMYRALRQESCYDEDPDGRMAIGNISVEHGDVSREMNA